MPLAVRDELFSDLNVGRGRQSVIRGLRGETGGFHGGLSQGAQAMSTKRNKQRFASRKLGLEGLEVRRLMAADADISARSLLASEMAGYETVPIWSSVQGIDGPSSWHNAKLPADVNSDGTVTPRDVLHVVESGAERGSAGDVGQ